MFGLRLKREVQKRWKKGNPPQRTTGVANASSSQGSAAPGRTRCNDVPENIAPMAIAISGAVRARLVQKRRAMSCNSGLASEAPVMVLGSRVMPQMGHEPGAGRTICGCMGQVYSVRVEATGTSGSRAMPQEGQAAGLFLWAPGDCGQ